MFEDRLFSLSLMMASVELLRACMTEFRQFFITKRTLGWSSLTYEMSKVEILKADTMISMIASHMDSL
jgi:hypothetical protein